jgi:beta-mannosidase
MKLYLFLLGFLLSVIRVEAQPLQSLDLSGTWKVTWNEGGHGPQSLDGYLRSDPEKDPARFLEVPVPMELHLALQKAGLVDDLNYGMNTLKARWVAEKYWLYVRKFNVPEDALKQKSWLVFEQLDLNAIILLNGEPVGTHHSAFVPCRIEVTGKLRPGENRLQVAIESGLYGVADKEGAAYLQNMGALLNKRHWLRKPQYQFLWDWNPQLINVGITGAVRLEWAGSLRLDQVVVQCALSPDLQQAYLTTRSFVQGWEREQGVKIRTTIQETGQSTLTDINLKPGLNPYTSTVEIKQPRLWWPAGQGDQPLYHITVEVVKDDVVMAKKTVRTGIRSIRIDQSPHPVEGNYFTIMVNNRKVFMKGGNWVPPDMIYSNIDRERLDALTDLALQANFNMLRIWGGAIWAGHDLLDLCDEKGLLVWHDLLFACGKYPGDDKEFYDLVKHEVTWGVREFSAHPSLAVWCGNNENEVGTWNWGWDQSGKIMPDYGLYHLIIPVIMREEDPSRPYWPSSPFSPGYTDPNSPVTGDQHPWDVSLGAAGPDFRAYRNYVDRFPNEGGVLGASSPATLRQFLPPGEQFIRSFSWDHHDNEVNFWNIERGLNYRMTEFWLGKKAEDLGFDKYALASELIQAEGLTEYISNYRRRMYSSSSAVFWMYNDSWPVTHGWTIVDYYLRKKLAFHPVRRAYQPVSVVVVTENDSVKIFGINDGPTPWQGSVRYGICLLAGGLPFDEQLSVTIPANVSMMLASFPEEKWKSAGVKASGAFGLLEQNGKTIAQYRLFTERFKDLTFSKPVVRITRGKDSVTFQSDVFIWGACIDTNGEKDIPDNCFDLLPGIPYTIPWTAKESPKVMFTGNELF